MRHGKENDIHLLLWTCNGVITNVWNVKDDICICGIIAKYFVLKASLFNPSSNL